MKIFYFSLILIFVFNSSCRPSILSEKTIVNLVECTEGKGIQKYKKGCIPFGEKHFCNLLSKAIKNQEFLKFMSGVWIDDNDPHGEFIYIFSEMGNIKQLAGSSVNSMLEEFGKDTNILTKSKVAKIGKLEVNQSNILLSNIFVDRGTSRAFVANSIINKVECFVGMPDQIAVRIIPEIGFRPYTEVYYEPIDVEIEYPSGNMRVIE